MRIKHCKLKEVTAKDLRGFTQITYLELSYNNLIILEANLFQFNPKLTEIHLEENLISFIDPAAFNGLNSLRKVDLSGNSNCYPGLEVIIDNAKLAMMKIQDSYECPVLGAKIKELQDTANSSCKLNQILNLKLILVTLLFIIVTIALHVALQMILYKDKKQIKVIKKHYSESKSSINFSITIQSQNEVNDFSATNQSQKSSHETLDGEKAIYEEISLAEAGMPENFYAEVNTMKEMTDDKMSRVGKPIYAVI